MIYSLYDFVKEKFMQELLRLVAFYAALHAFSSERNFHVDRVNTGAPEATLAKRDYRSADSPCMDTKHPLYRPLEGICR